MTNFTQSYIWGSPVTSGGLGIEFFDTFTSGGAENLEAHTPDTGVAWTRSGGTAGDMTVVSGSVRSNAYTTDGMFLSDDVADKNQYIEVYKTADVLSAVTVYTCLRISATNSWAAGLELNNPSTWRIITNTAGSKAVATADTGVMTGAFASGNGFRLEITGDTFKVSKDTGAGFVEQGTATISHNNTVTRQGFMHGANRSRVIYTSYKAGNL